MVQKGIEGTRFEFKRKNIQPINYWNLNRERLAYTALSETSDHRE